MNAYRGKVLVDTESGNFQFHTINGQQISIEPVEPLPELGKTIEALIIDGVVLDWQYDLTDLPDYEIRQIHIAVGFGVSTEEDNNSNAVEAATRWAKQLENEARRVGRDRWEVHAYPASYVGAASDFYTVKWSDLGAACRLANPDAPSFTHLCAISQTSSSTVGVCGRADLGGTLSWSKSTCVGAKNTHFHETVGHSIMAVEHSGTGNGGNPYGEGDTIMGNGGDRIFADFNTPHLYHGGLIEENNVRYLVPGESIDTYLVQGSDDPLSLKLGENKAILCHVANTGLTRRLMVSFFNGTVRVHEPGHRMTTNFLRSGLLRTFRAANLEGTFSGVRVRVLELKNDCARVQVFNQTTTEPETARIPERGRPDPATSPQIGDWARGQWGNRKWSVQGVHVGFNDSGKLVLHWLTWDRYEIDSHAWYWAVCDISNDGRLAQGTLITADKYGRPEEVGDIEVFWYSEEQGIARGTFNHGLRFAMPFTRVFAANPSYIAGYYGIGNGEGLTISTGSNGRMLCYWLGHNNNDKLWHMLQGNGGELDIYKVEGGQFSVKSDFTVEKIGTATLSNNTVTFNLDGKEPDERSLRRLA